MCAKPASLLGEKHIFENQSVKLGTLAEKSGEGELSSGEYALDALLKADAALDIPQPCEPVIMANAARNAADTIGRLLGMTYSSDMLEKLFSRFCVGK